MGYILKQYKFVLCPINFITDDIVLPVRIEYYKHLLKQNTVDCVTKTLDLTISNV